MMIPFIYDILLVLMLYVLYVAGMHLQEDNRILSRAGLVAILAFTLNEGLRYGRGIDYNLYAMRYEDLAAGKEIDWDLGYLIVAKTLIALDIPWQGFVVLMSCLFIVATLFLMKRFNTILPYALPLFILFSKSEVENMVRWYTGFSFVLIALYYLLDEEQRDYKKIAFFSLIACFFHLALSLLIMLFYLVSVFKKPMLSPIYTVLLFFGIAFFFQTDFMMQFVVLIQVMSMSAERFEGYGDNAEYWLTGGYAGADTRVLPGMQELVFLLIVIYFGYKTIRDLELDNKYVFAYNLFLCGFILYPVALQIELASRFIQPLLFFRGIVVAIILEYVYIQKTVLVQQTFLIFTFLILINTGRKVLTDPFKANPEHYLYIWDSEKRSYQMMYDSWIFDMKNQD